MSQVTEKTGITFIATGDELICGHVTNTVTPWMANLLHQRGYHSNGHRVVSDLQVDITTAIADAAKSNRIVVVTGGLGPTVDDRTRHALAEACGVALHFNDEVWAGIKARLRSFNLSVPDNNRSQAMFPEDATVIANHNGSAPGCLYDHEGSTICLLPGPPGESRPMFLETVLPFILKTVTPDWPLSHLFLLFGASEGHLATECEPLITTPDLNLGFRFEYPYLELKLFGKSHVQTIYEETKAALHAIVEPYQVGGVPYSSQLYSQLLAVAQPFYLDDRATGGRLISKLLCPESRRLIQTVPSECEHLVRIRGLDRYWQGQKTKSYWLSFEMEVGGVIVSAVSQDIPARGDRSLSYACEWLSLQWLEALLKL